MATFLRYLLLSLSLSLWTSHVFAQTGYCYWTGSGYNSGCWACQPGSGFPDWWIRQYCQGAAQTCVPRVESQTLTCQSGYNGAITQNRNITCANPYQEVIGSWYTISSTCTPTCTIQTQQQTLTCGQGYTGSITQQRSTSCPSGSWGAWTTTTDSCQAIPPRTETQVLSCQVHYSGQIVQQRTYSYQTQTYSPWQTSQNTCTQDPPTCQVNTQTQTLSCETGYTGTITQTRTSSCPDPYGSQVWGLLTTTTNTCVKSVTNPTNVLSPISPISPANPTSVVSQTAAVVTTPTQTTQTSSTSVPTTPSSPVIVETPTTVQNSETTQTTSTSSQTNTATSSAPTVVSSAPSTSATKDAKGTAPKAKIPLSSVPLALSLDLIAKPQITQPNLFPGQDISQNLPLSILIQDQILMDLLGIQLQPQTNKLNKMLEFTVEYEQ